MLDHFKQGRTVPLSTITRTRLLASRPKTRSPLFSTIYLSVSKITFEPAQVTLSSSNNPIYSQQSNISDCGREAMCA